MADYEKVAEFLPQPSKSCWR